MTLEQIAAAAYFLIVKLPYTGWPLPTGSLEIARRR